MIVSFVCFVVEREKRLTEEKDNVPDPEQFPCKLSFNSTIIIIIIYAIVRDLLHFVRVLLTLAGKIMRTLLTQRSYATSSHAISACRLVKTVTGARLNRGSSHFLMVGLLPCSLCVHWL